MVLAVAEISTSAGGTQFFKEQGLVGLTRACSLTVAVAAKLFE